MPVGWALLLTVCFVLAEWTFAYLVATAAGRRRYGLLWLWFFAGYPMAAWGLLALASSFHGRPESIPTAVYAILLGHLALGLLVLRIRRRALRRRLAEGV